MMRTTTLAAALALLASGATGGAHAPGHVTYIRAADVAAAFEEGRPLTETDAYKIHASRRTAPGQAEVHVRDTDVIHVLEGGATFVTGGSVVAPKTIAPDEIRGTAIEGGETRTLSEGDVIVVPNGLPHWFRTVDGPLLYYVVKVPAAAGGTR
jgi:glc operon protein GlcG